MVLIGAAGTPAASSAATSASRSHAAKARRQQRRQVGISSADAGRVGREAWGVRGLASPITTAQPCELAVIADRERKMAVADAANTSCGWMLG